MANSVSSKIMCVKNGNNDENENNRGKNNEFGNKLRYFSYNLNQREPSGIFFLKADL